MRSIRRGTSLPAAALTMALAGCLVTPAVAAGPGTGTGTGATAPGPGKSYDVTLITGDVVHYTDLPGNQDIVKVDALPGARGAVQTYTRGDDTYVIPPVAAGLLAAGALDLRLFNVSQLVEMGYDDARSGTIPVIAAASSTSRSARPPAAPAGAKAVRALPSIHSIALHADKNRTRAFWKAVAPGATARSLSGGIGKLWLDGKVEASLAESTAQINAPRAWADGFDGRGVDVAVLDTGADTDHPDLEGQIDAAKSFVPGETVDDGNGHGTHVASTVAGTGAASLGVEKGAAPGARLMIGKVLANNGSGADSSVIAGMEWAREQGADIVSMSLGTSGGADGTHPMSQALDALSADGGPLFVVSAGNSYSPGTVGAPGAARSALTVAAVDANDKRADFSSQGPLTGSHGLKPDVAAPGVGIVAAASQSVPNWSGGMYRSMNGTSMAAPHVSGAAAILKQRHPDWSGQRIKDALMSSSAKSTSGTPFEVGTGRVDVAAAVTATVEATGSVDTATFPWPNADAKPATRTLTYRNNGDSAVDLRLATDTDDDAYRLSASSVTVPAGGTSEVTLTLDPSHVALGTAFSGQVVATEAATGTVVAHSGFALYKERELYDYTIKITGPDGKPATDTVVVNNEGSDTPAYVNVTGEKTLRLAPGNYTAWSYMDVPGESSDSLGMALLLSPETVLDAQHTSGTADLDASASLRAYAVPERESEAGLTTVDFSRAYDSGPVTSGRTWNSAVALPQMYDSFYLSPTRQVTEGTLQVFVHWRMREKALDATTGSGHETALAWQTGSVRTDGRNRLGTVYAGRGATTDYQNVDARGKAVVVERDDAVPPAERAKAAADAGAAMLITVNDGRGRLYEHFPRTGELTVASAMKNEGERLLAEARSGQGSIDVRQKTYPDYTYDLLRSYEGHVPGGSLAYSPADDDLARVDSGFYAAKGTLGQGGRYFAPTWGPATGADMIELYGRTVTEFVTQQPAGLGQWFEQHAASDGTATYTERSAAPTYTGGKRYEGAWFKPVVAPRLGDTTYAASATRSGTLQWNVAMWSGGADGHLGTGGTGSQTTLYRGDTQVAHANSQSGRAWNAPQGTYRLVATGQRNSAAWPTSSRTRTTWEFPFQPLPADGPARADLPLLNLRYDVDTDLQGTVGAGDRVELGLDSATYPAHTVATAATLQVSYDDGATWKKAELVRKGDGSWKAVLRTAADARFVSLRATAEAPGGLSVEQEVIRAIGLR